METKDIRWQVRWLYVGAWWVEKAEMLKNHMFLYVFLRGQEGRKDAKTASNGAANRISMSKRFDLSLKMLYAAISNCASCAGGEHIIRKIMKTYAKM